MSISEANGARSLTEKFHILQKKSSSRLSPEVELSPLVFSRQMPPALNCDLPNIHFNSTASSLNGTGVFYGTVNSYQLFVSGYAN
jgi:hypothetical protein